MVVGLLVTLGICLGSFTNALVWRLHEQAKRASKKLPADSSLSIVKGRSMCTHCKHILGPLDLVPVVSWVILSGKCRYCHKAIDDSPFIELILPVIFVFSYITWPNSLQGAGFIQFGAWLVFLTVLAALFIYDLRWMLLPDRLVLPFTALAFIQSCILTMINKDINTLFQAVAAAAIISGIFYALFQLSDGRWIGGGDVKLGLLLGFLVGRPLLALMVIFIASLLGIIASLPGIIRRKLTHTQHIPFGPYLILATILVRLFGDQVITWYMKILS